MKEIPGGVVAAKGFQAAGIRVGVKSSPVPDGNQPIAPVPFGGAGKKVWICRIRTVLEKSNKFHYLEGIFRFHTIENCTFAFHKEMSFYFPRN